MDRIQIQEYRMQLSIATNPHTEEKAQKRLWNQLRIPQRRRSSRPALSEARRKEIRIQAETLKKLRGFHDGV
jgi:hypothetical protein